MWTLWCALAAWPVAGTTHPFHTSVSELTYDAESRTIAIRIRAFADDLATAVGPAPELSPDSAIARYVRATVLVIDPRGRPLPLRWEGAARHDDAVVMQLRASVPPSVAGLRLIQALLCDRYADQVNVVRAKHGGRRASLLFTRGDPAKPLP